ncbi:Alpha/Beta hydrolase protein [Trichoderma barbatum]
MEDIMKLLLPEVPTIEKYKQVATEKRAPQLIESLPTGGQVGWFGAKTATKVLGYLPGGGFCLNASSFQVDLAYEVFIRAREVDSDTALAVLSYDVCAVSPYPAQVDQAVRFAEHLLKGRRAEDVHLFGESAGGALIIAYILHLHHPHPKVRPSSFPANQKLGHILLISPSGPVPTSAASFTTNAEKDIMDINRLKELWSMLEANRDPAVPIANPWIAPALSLEQVWYQDWPVGNITIIWGEDEILRDDIARVADTVRAMHTDEVILMPIAGAGHCPFVMEKLMNLAESDYTQAIYKWAKAL